MTDEQLRYLREEWTTNRQGRAIQPATALSLIDALEKAREKEADLQAEAGYAESVAGVATAQRDSARALLREWLELGWSPDLGVRIWKELA